MKLILHDVPATIAGRLDRMQLRYINWPDQANQPTPSEGDNQGTALWLSSHPADLPLQTDALVIDLSPVSSYDDPHITMALQDSGFAVDHGFLLAVGGAADLVERAAPLLDALAPMPKAWLYAGGLGAPGFMRQVLAEFGGSWQVFAARMMAYHHSHGLSLLWREQQALAERLRALALAYIQSADETGYRAIGNHSPLPPISFPGIQAQASPAMNLAHYLCWFTRQVV